MMQPKGVDPLAVRSDEPAPRDFARRRFSWFRLRDPRARLSLRSVLFVALIIATIAPLVYLGPTQIRRWQQVQRRETDKELAFAAESLAKAVAQEVDADVRALETTAGQMGTRGSLDPELLTAVIHIHRERFHGCDGAHVSDLDGRAIAADPDPRMVGTQYGDRDFYQVMMKTGQTAISPVVVVGRVLKNLSIHVGVPVRVTVGPDAGRLLGYFGASVGLEHLRALSTRAVETFEDMQARVLDRQLHVIVDSDPEGAGPLTDLGNVELYREAPFDSMGLRDGHDERQRALRAVVTRISARDLDWTVVVTRPVSKIEEQGRRALWTTLATLFAAFALGLVMSFLVSSWLARPIGHLASYTVEVARGSDVVQPTPARWDPREVADLVETVGAMVAKLRGQADALRAREAEQVILGRFKREMEIAERIQSGILPKKLDVPAFEVAAMMKSADEVSGDYYEIVPTEAGCWIAIGDACGHGLNAGLLTLMLQSALGALLGHSPKARPADLLKATNALLFENLHNRLQGGDYVTLLLMHLGVDGRFVFAGAHEPFIVWRRATGRCELFEAEGIWMGLRPIEAGELEEGTGALEIGDMIVMYSDGIVERGASKNEAFGVERLCGIVERLANEAPHAICRQILREAQDWVEVAREDDMTVLALRYVGRSTAPEPLTLREAT